MSRTRQRKSTKLRLCVILLLGVSLPLFSGCGGSPPATVEGTLSLNGKPLDNCLVTFMPEPGQSSDDLHYSSGLTDPEGHYRLRADTQQRGTATGWHHVTIRDMSASSGLARHDHGTADIEKQKTKTAPKSSRIPTQYGSLLNTPLRKEIKQGHQVIDLPLP